MLKQKSVLEVKNGERVYQLVCDLDSPLGEVYDALHQMFHYVTQKINELTPKKPEELKEGSNEQSPDSNN